MWVQKLFTFFQQKKKKKKINVFAIFQMQMQKLLTFFFSKNTSLYAIFNDQSFNNMLTNNIVLKNWTLV